MDNDTLENLTILVVVICCFRFLLDGVSTTLFGQKFELGHMESLAYGSIMAPILAANGYIKGKRADNEKKHEKKSDDTNKNNN